MLAELKTKCPMHIVTVPFVNARKRPAKEALFFIYVLFLKTLFSVLFDDFDIAVFSLA